MGFPTMHFVHDETTPRAVKDSDGIIWVFRSTRDLPHHKAHYLIRWKNSAPKSVLADEILSEKERTFSVIINRHDIIQKLFPNYCEDSGAEADQLILFLTEAIYFIKSEEHGEIFEKRGIRHVVQFRVGTYHSENGCSFGRGINWSHLISCS